MIDSFRLGQLVQQLLREGLHLIRRQSGYSCLRRIDRVAAIDGHGTDGVDLLDSVVPDQRIGSLDQLVHLSGFRDGEALIQVRILLDLLVCTLGAADLLHIVERCLSRSGKRLDRRLELLELAVALYLLKQLFQILDSIFIDLSLLLGLQLLVRSLCRSDLLFVLFVVGKVDGVGLRELLQLIFDHLVAAAGRDHSDHIPRAVVRLRVAGLIVHGGPALDAAADVDRVARDDGDGLGALVEAAALGVGRDLFVQERLHEEVLVRRRRGHRQVRAVAVDDERVGIGAAALTGFKRGGQARVAIAVERQRFERRVRVAPRAADIFAKTHGGVLDADDIAVRQLAVFHGEVGKALVGEPVVERTHPAGLLAAGEFGKAVIAVGNGGKIGDVEIIRPVAIAAGAEPCAVRFRECAEQNGHHGVVFAKRVILPFEPVLILRSVEVFERGFVLALGAAAVVRVVLDADGHSTDLHAGRKGIAVRVVVDLLPILACSVFPALDLGAGINVVGSVGHVLEHGSARLADGFDGLGVLDSLNASFICSVDLLVLRMLCAVAVERGLGCGQRAVFRSGDLVGGAAGGNPRHRGHHVVIRHGEVLEAPEDTAGLDVRAVVRKVKGIKASVGDVFLGETGERDAAKLVLVVIDVEVRNLGGVRALDPVVFDAPRSAGVSDGVVVARNEIREVCLHARIRQRMAILVVLARAANLEVGGIGRVRAEVDVRTNVDRRHFLVIDLRLACVHLVEGKQPRHHRAAGGAVRAVDDAVLLKPLDHGFQTALVCFRHSREVIRHRQRVALRAASCQSLARGENLVVTLRFLHAELVALILRHRVVVALELVDQLDSRCVELRQIFGEALHERPEIGEVLRVRVRGLSLERLDAGLRSQLRRVSGSCVRGFVDAVHTGLVERFDRLPISLREALLRIVRILIRFLELCPQIVLDLREVCL